MQTVEALLPIWITKLPSGLQYIIAGAVMLHVVGLLIVLFVALKPSTRSKPAFSSTLKNK